MALDGLILHQELKTLEHLVPARINKISQPSSDEILLSLHHHSQNYQLLLCVHSQFNRLNLTKTSFHNPASPSAFVMLLRKYLDNGLITNIQQDQLDRCVKFTIQSRNELAELKTSYLFLELMGKYANLILTDENLIIRDAIKRIPPYQNTKRIIFAGALYQVNPRPARQNPFAVSAATLGDSFLEQFEGFSPLLAREVEFRLVNGASFGDIMQELHNSQSIFYYPKTKNYHVIQLKHLQEDFLVFDINAGFDFLYSDIQAKIRIEELTGNLFRFIKSELKKNNNKLPKLQAAYQEACACEKWRIAGDLIFINLATINKGMTNVDLFDYESQQRISIALDPKLDGKGNGNKYYQKYRKGKNGQIHLKEQITLCQQEITYFTALQEQLEFADLQSAREIKNELYQQNYLRQPVSKRRTKTKSRPQYLELSCENDKVFVGRNNLQNNYVTFILAQKNDTWFHAQSYHGAHVIIQSAIPSEKQIRFCANLAAYYSQGRQSSSVPVDYTLVKNLKKIPRSKAGQVSVTNYKTIFIDPQVPQ